MAEQKNPVAEFREKTDAEIVQELDGAYEELFKLRMRHATRQLENHQALRGTRQKIARLKTIQSERRLGIARG